MKTLSLGQATFWSKLRHRPGKEIMGAQWDDFFTFFLIRFSLKSPTYVRTMVWHCHFHKANQNTISYTRINRYGWRSLLFARFQMETIHDVTRPDITVERDVTLQAQPSSVSTIDDLNNDALDSVLGHLECLDLFLARRGKLCSCQRALVWFCPALLNGLVMDAYAVWSRSQSGQEK